MGFAHRRRTLTRMKVQLSREAGGRRTAAQLRSRRGATRLARERDCLSVSCYYI